MEATYSETARSVKFPCPENHKHTTVNDCFTYCKKHETCDIYATMLDEVNDMK